MSTLAGAARHNLAGLETAEYVLHWEGMIVTEWRKAVCLSMAMAAVAAGCRRSESPKPLRVLCGNSMAAPMQKIAKEFEAAHGVTVEFDLGGSETLLTKVLVGSAGDVYVCHDPFETDVREGGKLSGSAVTGWLCPIIVTAVGNPHELREWGDLAKPGLRLGIGDPRYSTCGKMFVAELRRRGLEEKVMRNVVVQARGHAELALGVTTGALDAAAVWNFVALEYEGKLATAPIAAEYPEVRVTVIGLSDSTQPELRDKFLQWCRGPESVALFAEHGYARQHAPAPANAVE